MTTPDLVVVSPPTLIGTDTVQLALNLSRDRVRHLIKLGDPRVMTGYLGKFAGRHVWNAHELFAGMFTSPQALWEEIRRIETGNQVTVWCTVEGCQRPAHLVSLCSKHLNQMMSVWRRAERSTLVVWQLIAMCTWVVERNRHLVPPGGWDPWSGICMTPSCQNRTDVNGRVHPSPLCMGCSESFWNHT